MIDIDAFMLFIAFCAAIGFVALVLTAVLAIRAAWRMLRHSIRAPLSESRKCGDGGACHRACLNTRRKSKSPADLSQPAKQQAETLPHEWSSTPEA